METTLFTENGRMPAVALRGLCILPGMIIHFDINRPMSVHAVEQAMAGSRELFAVMQKDERTEEPTAEELYEVGTICALKQITKMPNGILRVLVEGITRARLKLLFTDAEFSEAEVEALTDSDILSENEAEAMKRQLMELFRTYAAFYPKNGRLLERRLETISGMGAFMDTMTSGMPLATVAKQQVLNAVALSDRFDILTTILNNEVEISTIRRSLSEKIKKKVDKNQKDYLLREQMNVIREELGDGDTFSDADQFTEAVEKLKASKEVKDKIKKEISRFKSLSQNSSESAVERTYIETLLELPWDKVSKDSLDLDRTEAVLDEDHYGLEKVKERILEFLAVRLLTKERKGGAGKNQKRLESPIICLVGPPGTGKTSVARSMARALQREYVRISLGGVRDEAEIRGHRKTYVGAMPGRIAVGLKQAGVSNPLMLLDEIDKLSHDYKGDPSAALLEVLDSEQNSRFRDNYIELPLDLSQVLFVATANTTDTIPKPLLDRMELIEVNSYTDNEKFHIAKEHLLKKVYEKNGIEEGMLSISDAAIHRIIEGYTREAGVRNLERKLGEICRKAAREILKKKAGKKDALCLRITAGNLEKYLGKERYTREHAGSTDQVGIARGLAWTSVGGDTLQIEVNKMPGEGELELTGQLGDVMKESAVTALSYVRSVSEDNHISAKEFKENDFHIHIPEGAVPKDGPSAGITMATALFSALTGRKVRADVAMTGEVTLRGRVLPIGGLKEKILAAGQAGVKRVIVPAENKKDIEEISQEIKAGLQIIYAETMDDVLAAALQAEERNSHGYKKG